MKSGAEPESSFLPRSNGGRGEPSAAGGNGDRSKGPGSAPSERARFPAQGQYARVLLLAIAYSGVILAASWLAYLIRFEFHPPEDERSRF